LWGGPVYGCPVETLKIDEPRNARMEVEFPPDWRVLRDLRAFVGKLVDSVADSSDLAARVSMVVTELAENAVKYSGNEKSVVRLRVEPTSNGIRCESENEASAINIEQLERTLQLVNEGDPFEAYSRALTNATEETSSRIGLARIRHEGQMQVRCIITNSRVRIIAEMPRVAVAA
jgi:hypothetical protein